MDTTEPASTVSGGDDAAPKKTRLLAVGLASIAVTIGILVGLSATPVVGSMIPLLFTLVTAGGVAAAVVRTSQGLPRMQSLAGCGLGLAVFSFAFLAGLYLGVAAKLHWRSFWLASDRYEPAYQTLAYTDLRLLAAAIKLDKDMVASGLEYDNRALIFSSVRDAMAQRAQQRLESHQAINTAKEYAQTNNAVAVAKLVEAIEGALDNAYSLSEDFSDELYKPILKALENLKSETHLEALLNTQLATQTLIDMRTTATEPTGFDLLHLDELQAVQTVLELESSIQISAEPFRAIASEGVPAFLPEG